MWGIYLEGVSHFISRSLKTCLSICPKTGLYIGTTFNLLELFFFFFFPSLSEIESELNENKLVGIEEIYNEP